MLELHSRQKTYQEGDETMTRTIANLVQHEIIQDVTALVTALVDGGAPYDGSPLDHLIDSAYYLHGSDKDEQEFWAVTEYMGEKLAERGEVVGTLAGMTVWARNAALPQDSAIIAIHAALTRR